jgi:nitrogen regulatory protein PII
MKLIVAIVQPEKLQAVLTVLNGREVCLLAVSDVVAPGRGSMEIYHGWEVPGPETWLRVEIAANDAAARKAVEAIARAHGTAEAGGASGKIFVTQLEEYEDLRNGKREQVFTGS